MKIKVLTSFCYCLIFTMISSFIQAQTPIWEENFDGPSLDKKVWTYDVGGSGMGNGELEYYTDRPDNSFIENGNLVIEAKKENFGTNQFTSARLKTQGRFAFKYGIIEARIKLPNLKNGLWPAFWTLGTNIGQQTWPKCGEIDILEAGSEGARLKDSINQIMSGAVHWWQESGTWSTWLQADYSQNCSLATGTFYDDYHTYKMVWDASHIEMWLDSKKYYTMDITSPDMSELRQPQFILLNLAVGGKNYVNITDPSLITATLPAKMYVDYVKIYPIAGQTVIYNLNDSVIKGNYGLYTETTPVAEKLDYTSDGHLYLWNNMAPATGIAPAEGSEALAYNIAAGNWWGMGIIANEKNMSRFSDGFLHLKMKTATTETISIGINSTIGGDSWLDLKDGGEGYGLVRDNQWHDVKIPLNKFTADFNTVQQLFMMKGNAPASAFSIAIDDIYWIESGPRPTPANGNFGVYTDNTTCVKKFIMPDEGNFYVWENTLTSTNTTPSEGANVLSFKTANGQTWFGAAFTPSVKYNLTAFRYSGSKLHFDLKTTSTATFQIGMKSGNLPDIGQTWITFANGADPYGFVRDGNWHAVEIPMSDFGNVDLSKVSQLFELLGATTIDNIAIDNIYFTGGGSPLYDNLTPSVKITAPLNNANYSAPASFKITADLSASADSISKVDFYNGTTLLGTVTKSPYEYDCTNLPVGLYSFTAVATDTAKISATSNVVNVTVTDPNNAAPSVSITSPTDGTSIKAPANITITANASDTDGTISKVEFYNGDVLLGSVDTSPYTFAWNNVAAGNYSITARAIDNGYASTVSAAVNINVLPNAAPAVSITSPSDAATFTSPATITIDADASDSDGSISKVDFYNGSTLLGSSTSSPYSFTWNNAAVGSYQLTAVATDDQGASTTSSAVNITVTRVGSNLALNKPVTVTSAENAGTPGSNAVDGNLTTRWSSAFSDPQTLTVDLGASYHMDEVVITWEAAYGKDYTIDVSDNGTTWQTIKTVAGNTVLVNDFTGLTGTGRYIRMNGTARGTAYGYSMFEFEVYGSPATATNTALTDDGTITVHPNPTSDQVYIDIKMSSYQRIKLFDETGKCLIDKPINSTIDKLELDLSSYEKGTYILFLTGNKQVTQKKIIKF